MAAVKEKGNRNSADAADGKGIGEIWKLWEKGQGSHGEMESEGNMESVDAEKVERGQ